MRIIFRFVISFLITLFLLITYLSLFGIETQKFNNQIIKKIKSVNSDLNIKLKTIKIVFDPFQFDINAKTIAPEMEQEIIGIRPGEKIHEQMIGVEDAPYTYEYNDYFNK